MKKLHELLKLRPSVGDVGIEVEVEGKNLNPIDSDFWKTEDDGSLRGLFPNERSEYVLKKPVKIRSVQGALEELIEHQKDAKLNFSFRCSVHVHINVGGLTHEQFLAYLYLVILLEAPLMTLCGEGRIGNRFCLRVLDAEGYVDDLRNAFRDGPLALARVAPAAVRYSAINIASVAKYGSLEFRGMRGTLDMDTLVPWCQTLYRLREMAKKFGDPINVHDAFIKAGNSAFAKKCLGANSGLYDIAGSAHNMDKSFSLALELPHAFNDYLKAREVVKIDNPLKYERVQVVAWPAEFDRVIA